VDKVFLVELGGAPGRYCELELPASDYELLDAMDLLGLKPEEQPRWEVLEHHGFEYLQPYLYPPCTLYEANALARELSAMTPDRQTAFEGLFRMALAEKSGPYSSMDLIRYAKSVDSCQVVNKVWTDKELGKFCVDNGFIPETENLPEILFEILDYDGIGRKRRMEENGVFTKYGYVVRTEPLYDGPIPNPTVPRTPDYVFQLSVWDYFAEEQERKVVKLDLPATEEQLHRALVDGGIASWEEAVLEVEDSAIPGVLENMDSLYIDQMNELATEVKQIMEDGKLMLYKALLTEIDCDSISRATKLAGQLDDFILSPDIADPKDLAKTELRFLLSAPDAELVIQHVDLYRYGEALLEKRHSQLTGYGLLERRDGQPIQTSGVRNNDQTFHYERTKPLSQGMIMK